MVDAENEINSGILPVLQPLPATHFVNKKACSSQKQQEQMIYNHAKIIAFSLLRILLCPSLKIWLTK